MSRRRNGNAIRGPQSALTDFLASHNISAQQINLDYQARVRSAQEQAEQDAAEALSAEAGVNEEQSEDDVAEQKKRKRKQQKAIAKIKASKEFKKRKFEHQRDRPDESSDDDALARSLVNKPKTPAKPGQLSNCEYCDKRFTVTPYTLTGEDGGLLCQKCSKEIKDEKKKADNAAKKQKHQPVSKSRKRQQESDRMMGMIEPGAKSLVEVCVGKIANVVNDIEDFGDLPQNLLDRLSQILSKKRVLTSRTLNLFLQPNIDRIAVYDCGKLESEDFEKIFAFMPDLEQVNLRFAGQYKDDALKYMVEKSHKLKHLHLGAANLVTDDAWVHLFRHRGAQLTSLKLSELNDAMTDETVQVMAERCTNLSRLKMRSCPHMTGASINSISNIKTLEHLTLAVAQDSTPEALVNLITSLGSNLRTLCLEGYENADDSVLLAIKSNCAKLEKLRITGTSDCTDAVFADLFTDWTNPPLLYIDLNSNRDMDPDVRNEEEDEKDETEVMGFGSSALVAMFAHSGEQLTRLDLHSNRHISHGALLQVFDGKQIYPKLHDIDFSFLTHLDDVSMAGIFKSCPRLKKLAIFACFSARQAVIPRGVAVLGVPNAQMAVEIVGKS